MDIRQVEKWQAAKIHDALGPSLRYLHKLQLRMEQVGFLPTDPLFQLVKNARDAMQSLSVETHYLSCKSGVGRGSTGTPKPK